jgi:hypothetical protein
MQTPGKQEYAKQFRMDLYVEDNAPLQFVVHILRSCGYEARYCRRAH